MVRALLQRRAMVQRIDVDLPETSPAPPPRRELLAGLAFIEGMLAGGFTREALSTWSREHLGPLPPPLFLERGVGAVPLRGPVAGALVTALLRTAFDRVRRALQGLTAAPPDDRFVTAALFSGRVVRDRARGGIGWRATPSARDSLSDIVLAFFAADVLQHRELYDRTLSICERCGRVGFESTAALRNTCFAHRDPLAVANTVAQPASCLPGEAAQPGPSPVAEAPAEAIDTPTASEGNRAALPSKQTRMLALVGALALSGCSMSETIDCGHICARFDDCVRSVDVEACQDDCTELAAQDDDIDVLVDECDSCLDRGTCAEVAGCWELCSPIVR